MGVDRPKAGRSKPAGGDAHARRARTRADRELRALADIVPYIVWTARPDGAPDWCNCRWTEYTGLSVEEGQRGGWTTVLHEDDRQHCREQWNRAVATGEPYEVEYRLRRASDGACRWHLGRATAVRDAGGHVVRWFGTAIDVHELRQATERVAALQRVTAALATALTPADVADTVVGEGTAVFGASGGSLALLLEADAAGERTRECLAPVRVTGNQRALVAHWPVISLDAPLPFADVVRSGEAVFIESPADCAARYPALAAAMAASGDRSAASMPVVVDGRVAGVVGLGFVESRPFPPEDREFLVALARQASQALERARLYSAEREARARADHAREEAQHRRADAELARDQAELARSSAEEARGRADEANRAKSAFLATMSHELRTPLNAIRGYTELLQMGLRGPVTPEQQEDLARIQRAERHLLGVITDILNFARIETGKLEYRVRDVPLAAALEGVGALVGPQVRGKGLRYEARAVDPTLVARADPEKLQQILVNLLSNALKFTERGGAITLDGGGDAHSVHISVRDSGRGIPGDKLEEIFEPFVQAHGGLTRETQGVGLGLAISRELARGMGGDLTVESVAGEGSTFTVRLVRHPPP